ncbi:MAG: radical SAM protein, partial [bacterium]
MGYQGFITKDSVPFDPLELARETEKLCIKNSSRKYTSFYCTGVYGGISTGYLVGCCLRCVFCWVSFSRDYPDKYGEFFTPQEVFERLLSNARKAKVKKLRVSGGEPTLGKAHLLRLLDLVEDTDYFFVLETNGILLGKDPEYVRALKKYRNLYVRVSIKAGTPEGFERRTGGKGEFYELPYLAVETLKKEGLYFRVAPMSDSRLMPKEERKEMIKKLREIGYKDYLEEEICDPYDTSVIRLRKAG